MRTTYCTCPFCAAGMNHETPQIMADLERRIKDLESSIEDLEDRLEQIQEEEDAK